MKIKIINPAVDIPAEFTQNIKAYLEKYVRSDTVLEFFDITKGFRSVETAAQGIINGSEVLKAVMDSQNEDCDGIFINCFDDPAVTGARELVAKPVMGPYEAAVSFASQLSEKVGIVTTDSYGVQCETRKAISHGFTEKIGKIASIDLSVLQLTDEQLVKKLTECCLVMEKEGIYATVLGCTGMNYVAEEVQGRLKEMDAKIQLVEPVRIGVTYLEYMVGLGYTNRIYSTPIHMSDYSG